MDDLDLLFCQMLHEQLALVWLPIIENDEICRRVEFDLIYPLDYWVLVDALSFDQGTDVPMQVAETTYNWDFLRL